MTKDQIVEEVRSLSFEDREQLLEQMLLMDHPDQEAIDAAWLAESRRRDAAFAASGEKTIPVEEAIARVLARAR